MELLPRTQPENRPTRPQPGPLAPVFVPLDAGAKNEAGVLDWEGFEDLASYLASHGATIWAHQRGPIHYDIRQWIERVAGEKRGRENKEPGGSKNAPSSRLSWYKLRRTRESMDAMLEAAWGLTTYNGKLLMGGTDVLVGDETKNWKDGGDEVFYNDKLPHVKLLNTDQQLVRRCFVGQTRSYELVHVALCCAKSLSPTSEMGVMAWGGYWHWVQLCMATSVDPRADPRVQRKAQRVVTLLAPSQRIQTEVLAICMQSASISSPSASAAMCTIMEEGTDDDHQRQVEASTSSAPSVPTPPHASFLSKDKALDVLVAKRDLEQRREQGELCRPLDSSPLPPCPPGAAKTLVLDMDHTLIHMLRIAENDLRHQHSNQSPPCDFEVVFNDVGKTWRAWVNIRPGMLDFLEKVEQDNYQVVILTAGKRRYADAILDELESRGHRKLFTHRRFLDSCFTNRRKGTAFKDLSILGRDPSALVLIDDSPEQWAMQPDNVIPVSKWTRARLPFDDELAQILPLLHELAGVPDVRPELQKRLGLSQLVDGLAAEGL